MTLLAFAPAAYVLLTAGKPGLALLSLLAILAVERLPDQDFYFPGLTHRGVSHSVLAALVVGAGLGAIGWVLGQNLFTMLLAVVSASTDSIIGLTGVLPQPIQPIITGLIETITPREVVNGAREGFAASVDPGVFALFGFAVGVYGVLAHLLGDMITINGIQPLLPFSRWRLSLSSLRAGNSFANSVLFALGVIAIVGVVAATVPGVALGPAAPADLSSADLSPVDVADAQSANQTGNQTTIQSGNDSANRTTTQNRTATTNTTVVFSNQTVNGSTVTVDRVTLPASGFVVLDSSGPGELSVLEESAVAVSDRLSAGTHRNVSIPVNQSPPGGFGNRSTLNSSGTYEILLYQDSNNNSRFEFITTGRAVDRPFIIRGANPTLATDSAQITVQGSRDDPNATPTPTASVEFPNQRTNGSFVTVRSVTLPDGGWVVIHNESYLQPGVSPLRTISGLSPYLPPGTHRNVSVPLTQGVSETQTLVAIPSRDTNNNKTYEYPFSDGFEDVPYTTANGTLTDQANVTITDNASSITRGRTSPSTELNSPPTIESTAASPSPTPPPTDTAAASIEGSETPRSATGEAAGDGNDGGGWLSSNLLIVGTVVLAVLVILPTAVRRL